MNLRHGATCYTRHLQEWHKWGMMSGSQYDHSHRIAPSSWGSSRFRSPLLLPGLFLPVLTIRGVLTREGIAQVAPTMLEKGLSDETINVLKSMMNPTILGFLSATGGDLRKIILDKLTPQITAALQKSVDEVEVYQQTRSIIGSVRRLYEVGSPTPATLILLFSVIVPFGKAALVAWAMFMDAVTPAAHAELRRSDCEVVDGRRLRRRAVHCLPGGEGQHDAARVSRAAPLVAFTAHFGPGFYWFAAYCLFSLASQQFTARVATEE